MKKFKWQDIVIMVGNFIFAPSLLVSIIEGVEMPVATTLPTAVVLTAFVVCFGTLGLRLAAFSCVLTAICWYVLFFMGL